MSELDEKIAAWRLQAAETFPATDETVRELEDHLREQTAELMRSGTPLDTAFSTAVHRLGDPHELAEEFHRARPRGFLLYSLPPAPRPSIFEGLSQSRRVVQFILLGVIVALTCRGFDWALSPLINPGPTGLSSGDYASDFAHFIETRHPHHLINPAWVGDGYYLYWGPTETAARLAVLSLGTLSLYLLLRIAISGGNARLRPDLAAVLVPSLVSMGFIAFTQIYMKGGPLLAPHVRFALLMSPLLFVFLAVIQFIALQLARGERQRLVQVYAVGVLVFASGYLVVACNLGKFPPPPGSGPNAAFFAFITILSSPLYLTPMVVASWLLLRRKTPRETDPFSAPLKPAE